MVLCHYGSQFAMLFGLYAVHEKKYTQDLSLFLVWQKFCLDTASELWNFLLCCKYSLLFSVDLCAFRVE